MTEPELCPLNLLFMADDDVYMLLIHAVLNSQVAEVKQLLAEYPSLKAAFLTIVNRGGGFGAGSQCHEAVTALGFCVRKGRHGYLTTTEDSI